MPSFEDPTRTAALEPAADTSWLSMKPIAAWRHTGGYTSGHRPVTELPKVPGGPAPGARATD